MGGRTGGAGGSKTGFLRTGPIGGMVGSKTGFLRTGAIGGTGVFTMGFIRTGATGGGSIISSSTLSSTTSGVGILVFVDLVSLLMGATLVWGGTFSSTCCFLRVDSENSGIFVSFCPRSRLGVSWDFETTAFGLLFVDWFSAD